MKKLSAQAREVLQIMRRYPNGEDGLLEDQEQQRSFNEERDDFDGRQTKANARFSFDDYAAWAEIEGLIDEHWDLTGAGEAILASATVEACHGD